MMGIASLNAILRKAVLPGTVGADLVRDSRTCRRDSRMRSAPPHPHHFPVAAMMGIASLNAILRRCAFRHVLMGYPDLLQAWYDY